MLLLDSGTVLSFLKISVGSGGVVSSEYTAIYHYVLEIRHPGCLREACLEALRFVLRTNEFTNMPNLPTRGSSQKQYAAR